MYMSKELNGRLKQPTRPKVTKDFDNEELVRGTVNFPANMYEALRKQALERGVTMGSIIRDAITEYLEEGYAENKGIAGLNKKLFLEFLDELTEDEGFEIEGEEGFLAQVKERRLFGRAWTDDFLEEASKRYAIGFKGYAEPQDLDEHIERSSRAMKLTPQQKQTWTKLLKSEIGETEEESEEEEEW